MARVRKDNDQRYLLREEADSLGGDDSRISDGDIVAWTATTLTVAAKEPNWDAAFGWGDHATAGYLVATATDKSNWNAAFGWGDHATAGYLTSFTESDPTVPSHVKSITTTEKSNWNTAFGWGNHASAGYYVNSIGNNLSTNRITWANNEATEVTADGHMAFDLNDSTAPATLGTYASTNPSGWYFYSGGNLGRFWTDEHFSGTNVSNWQTAYGWGDHASEGYLTSYTETDTLDSVTDRGTTTTNSITVGGLTTSGNVTANRYYISTGYIAQPTGNYGTISVTGALGSSGSYSGYSVNNRIVLMNNGGTTSGLYNDTNNGWFVKCIENSDVSLYSAGNERLRTTGFGVSGVWSNNGSPNINSQIRKLTQAQYNAIGTKDANTLYIIVG